LIEFRKAEPTVRQKNFLSGQPTHPNGMPDVAWFGADGKPISWNSNDCSLVAMLVAQMKTEGQQHANHHLLMFIHAGIEPREFTVPRPAVELKWNLFFNTGNESPKDIYPDLDGPVLSQEKLILESRSFVCYVSPDSWV
jgi:isoamylase